MVAGAKRVPKAPSKAKPRTARPQQSCGHAQKNDQKKLKDSTECSLI